MVPFKCYTVLEPVIEETSSRFGALWKKNDKNVEILKQYCDAIDGFMEEFEAVGMSAEVCEEDLTIHITMECEDMVMDKKTHMFYQIMMRALSVKFSVSEDNNLNVEFVFPSVWEHI